MVSFEAAILAWCEETWGQQPVIIEEWVVSDEFAQVFIRVNNRVLIVAFMIAGTGVLIGYVVYIFLKKDGIQGLFKFSGPKKVKLDLDIEIQKLSLLPTYVHPNGDNHC